MEDSTTNIVGSETIQRRRDDEIWKAEDTIEIPSGSACNVVSYAFANLDQYDRDRPIFVDASEPTNCFSAVDVRRLVRMLITGLKARGVEKGDCVCIHAFNTIWYPVIWLAVIGAGGILFGVNPATPSFELQKHLLTTKTKFIFTDAASYDSVKEIAASCEVARDNIWVLGEDVDASDGARDGSFATLLEHGESEFMDADGPITAAYCTTSGTTGLPKAAKIPHSYFVAQCSMIESRLRSRLYQPKQLICLPVFHTFAAPIALLLPLRLGTTTYFLPRFEISTFTRCIDAFQITDTAIVPPILTALLNLPHDSTELSSLRYILCAGAPITAALQSRLYALLRPDAVVAQVWGATELGWVTMFGPGEKDESGSVGRLLPGMELKLRDRRLVGDEYCGEALIRSPAVFDGYLSNDDATAAAFDEEGFYKTGDLVYVEGNRVFVVGREKEAMKVNGWQVSPSEIEHVLMEHPVINDAAVVGISDTSQAGLEVVRPRAYVVRSQNDLDADEAQLSEQQVKDFVAARLVAYKRLTGGVVFVDSIPRNPTGKIIRRMLAVDSL